MLWIILTVGSISAQPREARIHFPQRRVQQKLCSSLVRSSICFVAWYFCFMCLCPLQSKFRKYHKCHLNVFFFYSCSFLFFFQRFLNLCWHQFPLGKTFSKMNMCSFFVMMTAVSGRLYGTETVSSCRSMATGNGLKMTPSWTLQLLKKVKESIGAV